MNYQKLMEKARQTNKERDQIDQNSGLGTPDISPAILLRTAMSAIECGIVQEDWNCVAEGQAMLEKLAEPRRLQ